MRTLIGYLTGHQTTPFEDEAREGKKEEAAEEGRNEVNDEKLVEKGVGLISNEQHQNEG